MIKIESISNESRCGSKRVALTTTAEALPVIAEALVLMVKCINYLCIYVYVLQESQFICMLVMNNHHYMMDNIYICVCGGGDGFQWFWSDNMSQMMNFACQMRSVVLIISYKYTQHTENDAHVLHFSQFFVFICKWGAFHASIKQMLLSISYVRPSHWRNVYGVGYAY